MSVNKRQLHKAFFLSCSQSLNFVYNIFIFIIALTLKTIKLTFLKIKISFDLFQPNVPFSYITWKEIELKWVEFTFEKFSQWFGNDCKHEIKYPWSENADKKNAIIFKRIVDN